MLLSAANTVLDFIGKPTLEWSKLFWKRVLYSPPYRQRQLDAWSCGLFVMMAVDAFGQNSGFHDTGDEHKHVMREKALRVLLTLP